MLPRGAVQTRGGGELKQYEVMLILPPEADESVVGGAADRISRVVSEGGGEVTNVDRWGRRRLAFEIDRQSEGYYVVIEFKAEPGAITELDRTLTLADEVLRFKVVVRAARSARFFPLPGTPSAGERNEARW
ncbi:MAG: 30S ribosomal protein S6 [Actinomycetota bacterium]